MTVKELIELLGKEDTKRLVIMSIDGEGNGHSLFSGVETCAWAEEHGYGEIGLEELTDELREQGYTEEDVKEDGVPALCFYPA